MARARDGPCLGAPVSFVILSRLLLFPFTHPVWHLSTSVTNSQRPVVASLPALPCEAALYRGTLFLTRPIFFKRNRLYIVTVTRAFCRHVGRRGEIEEASQQERLSSS